MKKNATEINLFLKNIEKKIVKDMMAGQHEVAEKICEDIKEFAPSKTGEYAESIKVSDTTVENDVVTTYITTDVLVQAKSNGNIYNLGYLLEHGTIHHAIPNAFNWGFIYGFDSAMYKRTLDPNWHPGFSEFPHFLPALNKNKNNYILKIKEVLDKEFK